jgi:uncharacterized membrane protein
LAERLVAVVALSAVAAFPVISPGLTTWLTLLYIGCYNSNSIRYGLASG